MVISEKIRKRYGTLKAFCDEFGLNYGSFRAQLGFKKVYGKNKEALIKAGIVKDEDELAYLLFKDSQAGKFFERMRNANS